MSELVRTEIEWTYTPTNFFDAPYIQTTPEYTLSFDNGTALLILQSPQHPVEVELLKTLTEEIRQILNMRAIQIHEKFAFAARGETHTFSDGDRKSLIQGWATFKGASHMSAELAEYDKDGNLLTMTKEQQAQKDREFLEVAAQKIPESEALLSVIRSYNAAIRDPADELIHLYEIRDRIVKEFKSSSEAQKEMRFNKLRWSRFGSLCNELPLRQGRHRGRNAGALRDATFGELKAARKIARDLIYAYLEYISR
ncbi:MAG TPA: hypothetical protein VK612_13395 [Pyrinomonadaceae bacterium]|nr:hypothetical protein [Pyrinomonadaceae bacterium]